MSDLEGSVLLQSLSNNDNSKTLANITSLKSHIKKENIQLDAAFGLAEVLSKAIASSDPQISNSALSCLGHLIKRLSLQSARTLREVSHVALPPLMERLGDTKERTREIAVAGLLDLWESSSFQVEHAMKERGLPSKNWRRRCESLLWISRSAKSHGFFRASTYVSYLAVAMEDPVDDVRNCANKVVKELLTNIDEAEANEWRMDVQKLCKPEEWNHIFSVLGLLEIQLSHSKHSDAEESIKDDGSIIGTVRAHTPRSVTPSSGIDAASTEIEPLRAVYLNSAKEVDHELHLMAAAFEGRETEQNWSIREKHVNRLRSLLRGNAIHEYQSHFIFLLKGLSDGIMKSANSLRTTLCLVGCQFIKDAAIIGGPMMDQFAELWLSNLIKLSSATKKITSQAASATIMILLSNVSFQPRLLQQLSAAIADKNPQTRTYAASWLRVLLEAHVDSRNYLEQSNSLDVLEKCVKRGLADANPSAREGMRKTLSVYSNIFPQREETQLQKAPQGKSLVGKKSIPQLRTAHPSRSVLLKNGARPPVKELATGISQPLRKVKSNSTMPHQVSSSATPKVGGLGLPQRQQLNQSSKSPLLLQRSRSPLRETKHVVLESDSAIDLPANAVPSQTKDVRARDDDEVHVIPEQHADTLVILKQKTPNEDIKQQQEHPLTSLDRPTMPSPLTGHDYHSTNTVLAQLSNESVNLQLPTAEDVKRTEGPHTPASTAQANPFTTSSRGAEDSIISALSWFENEIGRRDPNINVPSSSEDRRIIAADLTMELRKCTIDSFGLRRLCTILKHTRYDIRTGKATEIQSLKAIESIKLQLDVLQFFKKIRGSKHKAETDLIIQALLLLKETFLWPSNDGRGCEIGVFISLLLESGKCKAQSARLAFEETISDLQAGMNPEICLESLVEYFNTEKAAIAAGDANTTFAVSLMTSSARQLGSSLSEFHTRQLGSIAIELLNHEQAERRRISVPLCVVLHNIVMDDNVLFDHVLTNLSAGQRNLLAYYFAKHDSNEL